IELDDWLVVSIKRFDPDDQRTIEAVDEVPIHPVRDTLLGPAELERARERIRALCDAVDMPTVRARELLSDVESGRLVYGMDGLLPAFYDRLETLWDYVAADAPVVVADPSDVRSALEEELQHAEADYEVRIAGSLPAFELTALYEDEVSVADRLRKR